MFVEVQPKNARKRELHSKRFQCQDAKLFEKEHLILSSSRRYRFMAFDMMNAYIRTFNDTDIIHQFLSMFPVRQ